MLGGKDLKKTDNKKLRTKLENFFWEQRLGPTQYIASPTEDVHRWGVGELNRLIDKLMEIFWSEKI